MGTWKGDARRERWPNRALGAALAAVLALAGAGCAAGSGARAPLPRYFAQPGAPERFAALLDGWQSDARAASEAAAAPPVSSGRLASSGLPAGPAPSLAAAYEGFEGAERRELAGRVGSWIRARARRHFVPEAIDRWGTLRETLERNGDDCDGLATLAYDLLLRFGFPADAVYLGIVRHREDGEHHMVALWFEDARDPWVIDPTGAATRRFARMSALPAWAPLAVFSETAAYQVLPAETGSAR